MDAESSRIAEVFSWETPYEELAAVLAAYERSTGLRVCFRPMSGIWGDDYARVPAMLPFLLHRSSFCAGTKARHLSACVASDNTDLPAACTPPAGRRTEPFVRTCHAGADELLLPIWSRRMLVAVVFIGQFTRASDGRGPLRQLADIDLRHAWALALPMRSHLREMVRGLEEERGTERAPGRSGAIDAYLRESLVEGPTLPGLAARLSLSSSRAGHLVRELTGRSFRDLVNEHRVAAAEDLLTSTDGTIAWIARQTGFQDVAYFCRFFKQKTGMTPTAFRQKHRRVPWT